MAGDHQQPTVNDADENGNEAPNANTVQTNTAAPNGDGVQPPQHITIKFCGQDSSEISFRMKPHMKLGKAMDSYSARMERDRRQLRFLADGVRVLDTHTPTEVSRCLVGCLPVIADVEQLELEDGDVIEVHMEQLGGMGRL